MAKKLFDLQGTPTNLVIDRQGRIFFKTLGFAPGHEEIYAAEVEYLLARQKPMEIGARGT